MTARMAHNGTLLQGEVLELITSLTAAEVDAAAAADVDDSDTGAITLTGVDWRVFEQLHAADGVVLVTADGPSYLADLSDDDEAHAELTIELR
jgi:hypothetical protein